MDYASELTLESQSCSGVKFTIAKVSFGRRLELTRRIWELAGKMEFLEAGEHAKEKLEAALLAGQIDQVYLDWGLLRLEGLVLDGEAATKEHLAAAGPEELTREIVAAIKAQCGLSESERKNS